MVKPCKTIYKKNLLTLLKRSRRACPVLGFWLYDPHVRKVAVNLQSRSISCLITHISDLNLLDWSSCDYLAVALGSVLYLWCAGNGSVTQLLEYENPDEYISSVSWIKEGNILAVGNSVGTVQVVTAAIMTNDVGHVTTECYLTLTSVSLIPYD